MKSYQDDPRYPTRICNAILGVLRQFLPHWKPGSVLLRLVRGTHIRVGHRGFYKDAVLGLTITRMRCTWWSLHRGRCKRARWSLSYQLLARAQQFPSRLRREFDYSVVYAAIHLPHSLSVIIISAGCKGVPQSWRISEMHSTEYGTTMEARTINKTCSDVASIVLTLQTMLPSQGHNIPSG